MSVLPLKNGSGLTFFNQYLTMRKIQLLHLLEPCHAERGACRICEGRSVGLEFIFLPVFSIITYIAAVGSLGFMQGVSD